MRVTNLARCRSKYMRRNFSIGDLLGQTKPNGECLEWTRGCDEQGYGRVTVQKKKWRTHRLVWFLYHGPTDAFVLHSCDNRKCINPLHLRAGSHNENMDDMVARQRQAVGERQHKARLTQGDVKTIRDRANSGERLKLIAAEYGVSQTTITDIKLRRTWRHV